MADAGNTSLVPVRTWDVIAELENTWRVSRGKKGEVVSFTNVFGRHLSDDILSELKITSPSPQCCARRRRVRPSVPTPIPAGLRVDYWGRPADLADGEPPCPSRAYADSVVQQNVKLTGGHHGGDLGLNAYRGELIRLPMNALTRRRKGLTSRRARPVRRPISAFPSTGRIEELTRV